MWCALPAGTNATDISAACDWLVTKFGKAAEMLGMHGEASPCNIQSPVTPSPQLDISATHSKQPVPAVLHVPACFTTAHAVLGYTDKDNKYLPPYNWWADSAAQHLVDVVNKYYQGTGFTFYVQQVRHTRHCTAAAPRMSLVACRRENGLQGHGEG